jgi:hypothetical protein
MFIVLKRTKIMIFLKIGGLRFTSRAARNSNLKLRIIKRLKVHGVLSGLFHSSVGYMKNVSRTLWKVEFLCRRLILNCVSGQSPHSAL